MKFTQIYTIFILWDLYYGIIYMIIFMIIFYNILVHKSIIVHTHPMIFPTSICINHHGFWTFPPSKGLWGIRDHSSPAVRLNIWCSAVTWTGNKNIPETFRPFEGCFYIDLYHMNSYEFIWIIYIYMCVWELEADLYLHISSCIIYIYICIYIYISRTFMPYA